ncbi:MAG: hypothetical protein GBAus27B_000432 [Mycoplasmataceae bacterium]|nr:MAG: hypothetical protein GBAus27B_000432 [Mycoplasmataceae bacterium]
MKKNTKKNNIQITITDPYYSKINEQWQDIYQEKGLFHIYLTERKTGKSFSKILELITRIISKEEYFCWLRRHWQDSLNCSKPLFLDALWEIQKGIDEVTIIFPEFSFNGWEVKEKGVYYNGQLHIFFYDLYSFEKARGGRAKTVSEMIYDEAIPIDQVFLPREQWKFRDLVDSLKRKDQPLKITFLANPYSWSSWFLDKFTNVFDLKNLAESLLKDKKNTGIKSHSKDEQWFLYLNLVKPKEDVHSLALEERTNPHMRNWDDFMIQEPKKYKVLHAIQDFYFCELGERKKFKKYSLTHFTTNHKEVSSEIVNFCFDWEERAKSKLKNCVLREKKVLIPKWIKLLKENMLFFTDFQARDWFLEQIKKSWQ